METTEQEFREQMKKNMNIIDQMKEELWVSVKDKYPIAILEDMLKPKTSVKQGM
jgi:hypothetical protein